MIQIQVDMENHSRLKFLKLFRNQNEWLAGSYSGPDVTRVVAYEMPFE